MSRTRVLQYIARRADEDEPVSARPQRDLAPEAASILDGLVDALVGPGPRLWLHQRLARAWKVADCDAHILRRALVLAADHDLNAATLAVRAVAGTGASPAAAVMAGLAALIGPDADRRLSLAAAFAAEALRDPAGAVRRRLERNETLPGFGHRLYPEGDPRAEALIGAAGLPRELQALIEAGSAATGLKPSFELALALVVRRLNLPREAAFDLFAAGRAAGLLAHALDQARQGSPVRARLRYVGTAPAFPESR